MPQYATVGSQMSLVFDILGLQEIDDRIAALRAAVASVNQRLAANQELDDARRALQVAESRIEQLQRRQRQLDLEVASLNARIEPEERRLFSGEVQSPRELMSIQQEVEGLRTRRTEFEDQLLETMGRLETMAPRREAAASRVANVEQHWEAQQRELRHELRRHEDDIAQEEQKRELQASRIPPRPLALYDDLRRRKGGVAVARLQGASCQGCRVSIPDALRRQVLLRDVLVQCPNCEKILAPG